MDAADDTTDDEQRPRERTPWNTDPTHDYPVGPDDAGNAVMYGIGFVARGWRWLVSKVTDRH